jgi:DNA polymerase-3 subunit delta
MKGNAGQLAGIGQAWPATLKLVVVAGPDDAAAQDQARQLARGYSVETLAGATLKDDPQALLAAASAMGLFGDPLLVRVDGMGDDALAAVQALLAGPQGNPVVGVAGQLRKGSKLLTLLEAAPEALVVVNYEADPRQAGRLVEELAAPLGLKPDRDACTAIFAVADGNRLIMRQELEKLALFLDADATRPKPVRQQEVAAICGGSGGDASQFDLAAAVADGQVPQLIALLDRADPGLAIPLLRALDRHFALLASLRAPVEAGRRPADVVQSARPPIHFSQKDAVTRQIGFWPLADLSRAMGMVLAAEQAIKTSGSLGETLAIDAAITLARRAASLKKRYSSNN